MARETKSLGRIVCDNWDTLKALWGCSPSTTSLPNGVESYLQESDEEDKDEQQEEEEIQSTQRESEPTQPTEREQENNDDSSSDDDTQNLHQYRSSCHHNCSE